MVIDRPFLLRFAPESTGLLRVNPRHYPAHKNGQLNISELARVCDISRTTAYKYKSFLEA